MVILLKSYNNDLLTVSKVNSVIFDLCDKIMEISSQDSKSEIKIMFFVISIMQYVKLLGMIDKKRKEKEEMSYKEMMKCVEEMMKTKEKSGGIKKEQSNPKKEERNKETFDKKKNGNEKDRIKEMEKQIKELTEALANEKEKNQILKEQLNDKNNAIMKLKEEQEIVKSLETDLKICQNNNMELSN